MTKQFLIALSIFLTMAEANAFFFNSKVTVFCYLGKGLPIKLVYEVKNNEVIETTIIPANATKSGKDAMVDMEKLENCTVVDSKNWKCGGKNVEGGIRTETHMVHDGRYSFLPHRPATPGICDRRIQSD